MWKYLLAGAALLMFMCGANTLQAAPACGDHTAITEALGLKWGEQKEHAGLMNGDTALEVYANPKTGTWTIIMVNAEGLACLVASGEVWLKFEYIEPVVGEPL